jgi:hypothetical protein
MQLKQKRVIDYVVDRGHVLFYLANTKANRRDLAPLW